MLKMHGKIPYIDFDIFKDRPGVKAVFSTKKGGVSSGIYESMNLALSSDDDAENVMENYRRFTRVIDTTPDRLVISDQKHTTNIMTATEDDAGKGIVRPKDYEAIDGFITGEKNLFLCLIYADCVPIYLYDPVNEVIALLHSGWKGTVGKISAKAIDIMKDEFSTDPKNVLAAIGPSICKDCYEVSEDLFFAFREQFSDQMLKKIFSEPYKDEADETKYKLSLWAAIELTLAEAGVYENNICNSEICTCCNHELFFSHRYTKGRRGNMAAIMGMV